MQQRRALSFSHVTMSTLEATSSLCQHLRASFQTRLLSPAHSLRWQLLSAHHWPQSHSVSMARCAHPIAGISESVGSPAGLQPQMPIREAELRTGLFWQPSDDVSKRGSGGRGGGGAGISTRPLAQILRLRDRNREEAVPPPSPVTDHGHSQTL